MVLLISMDFNGQNFMDDPAFEKIRNAIITWN